MLNSVNVPVQTVAVNAPVIFASIRIRTGCCVRHEQGSGRFVLLKPGIYRVSFNGSMTAPAVTTGMLNLTQEGEQIAGANITAGTGPSDVESVSFTTLVRVFCNDTSAISVVNTGTAPVNITQANIVIERVC